MTTLTRIFLDRETRARMGQLALPYIGAADVSPLMRQFERLLTARFPKREIKAIHAPVEGESSRLRVLLVVDGEWDQAVFFTLPDPEPAVNDNPSSVEAAA